MNERQIKNKIHVGFFGTSDYSVMTLEALTAHGFDLRFIVTMPDKPKGRGLELAPPPAKEWAVKNNVSVFQPESLKDNAGLMTQLRSFNCDVFIVIAYGKIIPESIINIPPHGSLNIHASLLPRFRGSCPIETAILEDERKTGVTIIHMNAKMDEGPIVAMKEVVYEPWPPTAEELGERLVNESNKLLISILPDWIAGKINEREQDHSKATYTKKIVKEDGLIDWKEPEYQIFRKIQAYHEWPSCYSFIERGKRMRVKIGATSFKDGRLVIEKVTPESSKEISYADFVKEYGSLGK